MRFGSILTCVPLTPSRINLLIVLIEPAIEQSRSRHVPCRFMLKQFREKFHHE